MSPRQLFSFSLFQGLVWCLAALGYFYVSGFYTDPWGLLFTLLFVPAHLFMFAWLIGLLCFPVKWVGKRALTTACVAAGGLFSFFLLADMVVFAQYRFHIGLSLLELFFGPAGREIFIFSWGMWLLIGFLALLIIALEITLVRLSKKFTFSNKTLLILLGLWTLFFVAYNATYAWGKFKMIPSVVAQQAVLPLAYPLSANRRLEKWGFTPSQRPYQLPHKGSLTYPLHPLTCSSSAPSKNILIIMLDSWRADTFTPQVMPKLSAWSQRPGMQVFTNHLSGGNSTIGGVFSLFYAVPHSYWDDFTSQQEPPILITEAQKRGYEPGIFASSSLSSPAFYRNVFSAIPNLRMGSSGKSSWARDINAVDDFEKFLQTRNKQHPFFGFIFLDAPHAYEYPAEYAHFTPAKPMNYLLLNNRTDPTPYANQYKNAVYFNDALIDRVLTLLEKQNLLSNTLVILTGDHGQELNDSHQNFWGHNSNFADYQTKVPFIVYDASRTKQTSYNYRTSHHDVVPTLLQEVYGCTNPPADYALGRSLFDPTPRPFTVLAGHTEKVIRSGDDITVLNKFGSLNRYDNRLTPIQTPPDPEILKEGLKAFSRFYK